MIKHVLSQKVTGSFISLQSRLFLDINEWMNECFISFIFKLW